MNNVTKLNQYSFALLNKISEEEIQNNINSKGFRNIIAEAKTPSQLVPYYMYLHEIKDREDFTEAIKQLRPDLYKGLNYLLANNPSLFMRIAALGQRGAFAGISAWRIGDIIRKLGGIHNIASATGGDLLGLIASGLSVTMAIPTLIEPIMGKLAITENQKRKLARKYYEKKQYQKFQKLLDEADEIAYKKLEKANSEMEREQIKKRIGYFSQNLHSAIRNAIMLNFSKFAREEIEKGRL